MLEFHIPAMTCGHCVGAVTGAIRQADPRAVVDIDLPSQRVRVDTVQDRETIAAAVREAGYDPQ